MSENLLPYPSSRMTDMAEYRQVCVVLWKAPDCDLTFNAGVATEYEAQILVDRLKKAGCCIVSPDTTNVQTVNQVMQSLMYVRGYGSPSTPIKG